MADVFFRDAVAVDNEGLRKAGRLDDAEASETLRRAWLGRRKAWDRRMALDARLASDDRESDRRQEQEKDTIRWLNGNHRVGTGRRRAPNG